MTLTPRERPVDFLGDVCERNQLSKIFMIAILIHQYVTGENRGNRSGENR